MSEPVPIAVEESTRERFYASIGKCISIWSYIEEQMSWTLATLFDQKNRNLVSAIFYSASAFEQKLAMLDVAMRFELAEASKREWSKIHQRLLKKARRRNHIAHFQIVYEQKGHPTKYVPVLQPHVSNAKAMLDNTQILYAQHDLEALFAAFNQLNSDLRDFTAKLVAEIYAKSDAK